MIPVRARTPTCTKCPISSPRALDLVTLHIYSPPLYRMNMYSLMDAKMQQFFDPVNEEIRQRRGD